MPTLKHIIFVFIWFVGHSIESSNSLIKASVSVEKPLKTISTNLTQNEHKHTTNISTKYKKNGSQNFKNNITQQNISQQESETKHILQPNPNEKMEIPESFKMGFYFFIGLSITGIFFILIKIHRMRFSRAERKYGVHGDKTTQELTPLPMSIEDDSDNEDHTVFDINRQIRVS